MPSLALGKLLSSGGSKANTAQDGATKKTRGRSSSDKRRHENSQPASHLPTPPVIDRTTSDSYFTTAKRRTTAFGDNVFSETDDYGFPVVEYSHSPTETEIVPEPSRPLIKGKCRTCSKAFQTGSTSTWRCDQCSTINNLKTPTQRSDHERNLRPLSISRAQDVLDHSITDGLKRMDERKSESIAVGPNTNRLAPGRANLDIIARQSMLIPPPKGPLQLNQRRGSAPDTSRPSVIFQGTPPNGQAKRSNRRNSPGPLALNGLNPPRRGDSSPLPSPARLTTNLPPLPPAWSMNTSTPSPKANDHIQSRRARPDPLRESFRPLFDYLMENFRRNNLNGSFSTIRRHHNGRSANEHPARHVSKVSQEIRSTTPPPKISQMDHKDLMIGDVYDVATSLVTERSSPSKKQSTGDTNGPKYVSQGSPHIDWRLLQKWYDVILNSGSKSNEPTELKNTKSDAGKFEKDQASRHAQIIEDLRFHIRSTVLDLAEQVLVSPQEPPEETEDIRYLLILMANPLLLSPNDYPVRGSRRTRSATLPNSNNSPGKSRQQNSPPRNGSKALWNPSKRSRVLSLILGSIANLPLECHTYITGWLSRYPEDLFRKHADMILEFINERVSLRYNSTREHRKDKKSANYNGIPTSQMFNDMLQTEFVPTKASRSQDWQLRAACKVLQLFVRANDHFHAKSISSKPYSNGPSSTKRRPSVKQLISTEHFYNSQLDSEERFNPRRDFDEWEKKEEGLHLSQYPFLLTLGTKIQILEFDARKKMASKARQEFFDSILRNTSADKYFHLNIRRKCIIEDSLQRISEAISSSEEEAKKALKVHFEGEDGIDAGGLRKEWFLLLVKELLDPDVGLFLYNEETNFCYFNPSSLESSEQYQLVGAVLGLAIYNFTILDVPFPPFLFRKLAAAAPQGMGAEIHQGWRPTWRPDIGDLAQYDPALARNLQQILDYDGNVAEDIGAYFQIDTVNYGKIQQVSLGPGGENRVVNKKNREEYVDLYVDYLLDKAVRRQFEPFARGFFNVCGGNALSLFRGEEIELLIRGSGELDFNILRGTAVYENWKDDDTDKDITKGDEVETRFPVVKWFWELMELSEVDDQRRVLRWITGSDRIPAAGSLTIRIQCLGTEDDRLPQARTCFNMLQLWNYSSRRSFIRKFWYAVVESEGFGLK
ncbi:hypothetical protein BT63DRAFT_16591 [Microthyrium microscopicum]|uniref:HECT-type E3 ubiquitin transferase n=1 Tax=Microthyrium microscopicum TaxID=703497 RepID=A0A6A6USC4_9PEZI|nr:hypothetical protein BT63DRAFT_16591 [Microthyrium microscopicum]